MASSAGSLADAGRTANKPGLRHTICCAASNPNCSVHASKHGPKLSESKTNDRGCILTIVTALVSPYNRANSLNALVACFLDTIALGFSSKKPKGYAANPSSNTVDDDDDADDLEDEADLSSAPFLRPKISSEVVVVGYGGLRVADADAAIGFGVVKPFTTTIVVANIIIIIVSVVVIVVVIIVASGSLHVLFCFSRRQLLLTNDELANERFFWIYFTW